MPITATPIDVGTIVVPDDLRDILCKGGRTVTPTFDAVLGKHRKLVSGLRRQMWPVATDPATDPVEPADEPVDVPAPGADEPETAPEPSRPVPVEHPTVDR